MTARMLSSTPVLTPLLVFAVLVFTAAACGPGTNPRKRLPAPDPIQPSYLLSNYGPHYASGQDGEALGTAACSTGSGRPCLRARASLGTPYTFDANTSDGAAVIGGGPPTNPTSTVAGAGFTKATLPGTTRAGDRDLGLLQNQSK